MREDDGAIFDALVHGLYYALAIGAVAGIAEWSFKVALMATAGGYVITGIVPAIYHLGRRDRGRNP